MNFKEGIKLNVTQFIQSIDEADYLPWATAVALAGRPYLGVRAFEGKPYLDMFGGAVVAVDQELHQVEQLQETWMPIIDERWRPVPIAEIDAMVVHQQIMRAKAKSVPQQWLLRMLAIPLPRLALHRSAPPLRVQPRGLVAQPASPQRSRSPARFRAMVAQHSGPQEAKAPRVTLVAPRRLAEGYSRFQAGKLQHPQ